MNWASHHLHWGSDHHPHWHHQPHGASPHHPSAGAYVGRIGALAVTFGIGTATAAGVCAACAYADTGDSPSGRSGSSSSSQSVNPGPRRSQVGIAQAGAFTPRSAAGRGAVADVAQPAAVPASASSPSHRNSPAEIRLTLPDAVVSRPAVSPGAMSGNAPTVPADAGVALLAGAARRGERGSAAKVSAATATAAAATSSNTVTTTTVEAEKMAVSPSNLGRLITDRVASGGSALTLTGAATASATVNLPASTGVTIRAKTNAGSPNMTLSLDGKPVTTVVVRSTGWTDYTITGTIAAGVHMLSVGTSNATALSTLYLDRVTTMTGPLVIDFAGKSGTAPNSTYWTSNTGTGWDGGVENYTSSNTYLDGKGNLVIRAAKTTTGYTSGWVESKNKLSLGYGTVTARIKVPKGQGLWPAFWLKGADEDTTAWPTSGEIDVMELPSTTTTMYSTLHGPIDGSSTTQQAQIVSTLPDLSTDYHTYWVRHLENQITVGVDGTTLGTLTPDSLPAGATWVYNRPMQVIMNLAVGGAWAGAPDGSTQFPANMSVDWVRWDPA